MKFSFAGCQRDGRGHWYEFNYELIARRVVAKKQASWVALVGNTSLRRTMAGLLMAPKRPGHLAAEAPRRLL